MDRLWSWILVVFFALLLFSAAFAEPYPSSIYIPPLLSLPLIAVAALRLRKGLPSRSAFWALIIVALGLIWMGLQLVPLPVNIWTNLPGHAFVAESLKSSGAALQPMPLGLSPSGSLSNFIFILPGLAFFLAGLSIAPTERLVVTGGILAAAMVAGLLGLMQRFGGVDSAFQFYARQGWYFGGPYSNHNHLAALLYSAIPLVCALAITLGNKRNLHWLVAAGFAAIAVVIYLAGLGATGSRAGILLAMLAVLASGIALWPRATVAQQKSVVSSRILVVFVAIILLAAAQFGLAGILRLANQDAVADYRSVMAAVSLEAAKAYLPFGSGFGSFVPVYAMFEHQATLQNFYVNHAHNDWIELVMEGGLPMAAILLLFLVWLVRTSFRIWRNSGPDDTLTKAGVIIIVLLLAHSTVDYPLRTRSLLALFALCCAWLASGPVPIASRARRAAPRPIEADAISQAPRPIRREGPFFAQRDKPPQE